MCTLLRGWDALSALSLWFLCPPFLSFSKANSFCVGVKVYGWVLELRLEGLARQQIRIVPVWCYTEGDVGMLGQELCPEVR